MEQAMVLADGDLIGPEDLPPAFRAGSGGAPDALTEGASLSLRQVNRRRVLAVVKRAGGNRTRGRRGEMLEVSERTLRRLLKRYGCPPGAGDPVSDRGDDA
jgi:DNA-binding NtrC family response regulator